MCDLYTRYLQEIIYLKKKNEKSQTRKIYYTIRRFILFSFVQRKFPNSRIFIIFLFFIFCDFARKKFFYNRPR